MRIHHTLIAAGLVAAVLAATACTRTPAPAEDTDPLVLRTYAVPAERTEAIADALNRLFDAGDGQRRIGRASFEIAGKVPVLAPLSMQQSIADSIATLGGEPAPAGPPQTYRMRYWLIDAAHAEGADDPQLREIAASLDAVRAALGPAHFRLFDYGDALVASNTTSAVGTVRGNEFLTTLTGSVDSLRAKIDVTQAMPEARMSMGATMDLLPDQLLVLTRTLSAPATDDTPATSRLVIVQAQTLD